MCWDVSHSRQHHFGKQADAGGELDVLEAVRAQLGALSVAPPLDRISSVSGLARKLVVSEYRVECDPPTGDASDDIEAVECLEPMRHVPLLRLVGFSVVFAQQGKVKIQAVVRDDGFRTVERKKKVVERIVAFVAHVSPARDAFGNVYRRREHGVHERRIATRLEDIFRAADDGTGTGALHFGKVATGRSSVGLTIKNHHGALEHGKLKINHVLRGYMHRSCACACACARQWPR